MPALHRHFSLQRHNTFGVESHAALYASPSSPGELEVLLQEYPPERFSLLVIGEGSNILFRSDFNGLVIRPACMGIEQVRTRGNRVWVRVGAGENWDSWVATASGRGWYGLENLSLIPGSVGAAPVQNIGAYGVEVSDHFAWLDAYDTEKKEQVRMDHEDCRFGYRSSIFKSGSGSRYIILSVTFCLHTRPVLYLGYGNVKQEFIAGGGQTPGDLRKVIISIRQRKLPDPADYGNAGSFFKNPVTEESILEDLRAAYPEVPTYPDQNGRVKIPAAWLIEKAGWKGKRIGSVGTWPNQPLVVVNYGNASGQEILDFTERIRRDVFHQFGIDLEREVRVV